MTKQVAIYSRLFWKWQGIFKCLYLLLFIVNVSSNSYILQSLYILLSCDKLFLICNAVSLLSQTGLTFTNILPLPHTKHLSNKLPTSKCTVCDDSTELRKIPFLVSQSMANEPQLTEWSIQYFKQQCYW